MGSAFIIIILTLVVLPLRVLSLSRPLVRVMIEDIEELGSRFEFGKQYELGKWYDHEEINVVRRNMLSWYSANRRMLPWRGDEYEIEGQKYQRTRSAYGTWVSEIMLQQTRVETVITYWHNWMARFPSVASLASASPEEVNKMWAGLGYYNRAQRLLQGAKEIMEKHNGELPSSIEGLKSIPGVGPYTAGAISSIAFGKPEPLVDGNVIRVFSRMRALTAEDKSKDMEKVCWNLASGIVDPHDPGSFNQALMELGATVCKPTNPSCGTCPVATNCVAKLITDYRASSKVPASGSSSGGDTVKDWKGEERIPIPDSVTAFPFKTAKKAPREVILSVGVYVSPSAGVGEEDKYLFVRRPPGGLLANQWEFPTVIAWEESAKGKGGKGGKGGKDKDKDKDNGMPEIANIALRDGEIDGLTVLEPIVHVFSHQRHTMLPAMKDVGEGVARGQSAVTSLYAGSATVEEDRIGVVQWVYGGGGVLGPPSEGAEKKETRWMTATEILDAGITSGCKKVLEAVQARRNGGTIKAKKEKKKRAEPEAKTGAGGQGDREQGGAKQAKISSFFAPK